MISQDQRVPSENISYILRKGSESQTDLFIIRTVTGLADTDRFRTIVSKKIDKEAVKRNKIRRRIYEAIRVNQKNFASTSNGLDYILIPKKRISSASFKQIKEDISQIWKKQTNS